MDSRPKKDPMTAMTDMSTVPPSSRGFSRCQRTHSSAQRARHPVRCHADRDHACTGHAPLRNHVSSLPCLFALPLHAPPPLPSHSHSQLTASRHLYSFTLSVALSTSSSGSLCSDKTCSPHAPRQTRAAPRESSGKALGRFDMEVCPRHAFRELLGALRLPRRSAHPAGHAWQDRRGHRLQRET